MRLQDWIKYENQTRQTSALTVVEVVCIKEYDEYDRYYVYACHECEGTGEIARQSVTSKEVQEAIVILTEWRDFLSGTLPVGAEGTREIMSYNLAITALQEYQPWVSVSERLPEPPKRRTS